MKFNLLVFILLIITCTLEVYFNRKENKNNYQNNEVENNYYNKNETASIPKVEIILPVHNGTYTWGSQVRYSINVEDESDGESRYNEINPSEVFLDIEFISTSQKLEIQMKDVFKINNNIGLAIIGRSSCFGCHADKGTMVGPSFSEISDRYIDSEVINRRNIISDNIINGTVGIWGEIEMPSYPDFSEDEAITIADYILTQGAKKNGWVYPGLEGVFRLIDQPDNNQSGYYLLTASYTSSTQILGQNSIVLNVTN